MTVAVGYVLSDSSQAVLGQNYGAAAVFPPQVVSL